MRMLRGLAVLLWGGGEGSSIFLPSPCYILVYAREEPSICVLSPFISLQIWIVIDYFLTFALAKETDGTAATLVVTAKEIFEIIDIDKQKCSNKRLGNERPNRQLRPLLR